MKKTIIILMFILLLPLVYALYGGESKVISSFEKCLNLTINVNASSQIDEGEFSFLNCSEINRSNWFCNCSDNFNLTLKTKPNTLNNYTFNIAYYNYSDIVEEQASSGSGGGGGSSDDDDECYPYWKCTEWSECKTNNRATRECNDLNKCNSTKPSEKRVCYYNTPKEIISVEAKEEQVEPVEEAEQVEPVEEQEEQKKRLSAGIILLIILGVLVVLLIAVFFIKSYEWQ